MINQTNIMYKQLIKLTGTDGLINNNICRFLVTENNDNDENNLDYKNIITDQAIKQGDYISLNDSINYMIVDKTKIIESDYTKCNFRKILPIQLGSSLKNIEAVIDKNRTVLNDTGEIVDVHDQYQFIVPALDGNGKTNNVNLSQIIYDGGLYNIISIDTSREGLIIYIGKFSEKYNPHTYEVSLAENMTTIVEGGTYQISNVICKDNGTVVTSTLTYSSSDVNIASVDDKGLVTGIKVGTCNISVTYNGVSAILSLTVNVKPSIPVVSYSATSSNGYSFKKLVGATLSYFKTIDGVADTTLDISFSLDSVGQQLLSSSQISLVKKTASTLYIRNLTVITAKSFVLTVTDNANGAIVATQTLSTTV